MKSGNIVYIEKLDHIRFLAAFAVLEYHADIWFRGIKAPSEWLPLPLFHRGYVGVALFMVISGMILSAICYEREIDVPKFYLNRILRIYPLLIFVVALGYFATPDPRDTKTGVDFLLALLPISNLYRLHYGMFGGVLFSVAIELQFYLLFPVLLMCTRRFGTWYVPTMIACLIALCAAVFALTGVTHDFAYFSIFGALDIFLIGMVAGNFYMGLRAHDWRCSGWWVLATFVLLNAFLYAVHLHPTFFNYDFNRVTADGVSHSAVWIVWPPVEGSMFAVFIIVYLRSRWTIPFSKVFAYLGKVSYSLYVWHTLVFLLAVRANIRFMPPYEMGALIVLPVTVGIAALSYRLIEEPFLKMRVGYIRATLERKR